MKDELYASSIYLGDAPAYLHNDTSYYSYDGHYFYPMDEAYLGFHQMIDDMRSNTYTHSLNANKPYYNYYQYLSHRSTSKYQKDEINSYFHDTLGIQSPLTTYHAMNTSYHGILTQSNLLDQASAFLQFQDEFGANALMMLSLAMNESASDRSYLAYTNNNLFGHAAFDSAVEENASRYTSIGASIYSHAKNYISNSYLNPTQFQYHGGWFGNKASGMNVSYASDPYWGEKAAQYSIRLDETLGDKDKNFYALGIHTNMDAIAIYESPSLDSDVLYETKEISDFAFVLLEKSESFYKIQAEPTPLENGRYDFKKQVGYVPVEAIDVILNPEQIQEVARTSIYFDALGGSFMGNVTTIDLSIENTRIPSILPPIKENELFVGWDKELEATRQATTYTAQYQAVESTRMKTLPKLDYTQGEFLDVQGGLMELILANGERKEIALNSSMVKGYDPDLVGSQIITVEYQGNTTSYDIFVLEHNDALQNALLTRIEAFFHENPDMDALSTSQSEELLSLKQAFNEIGTPQLSSARYRQLDAYLQKAYGSSLQILVNDDDLDVSVSGLAIATKLSLPHLLPSIIEFNMREVHSNDGKEQLEKVALGNGYTMEKFFELRGSSSFSTLELHDDLLITFKKPENTKLTMDYLILRYKDGDIYQIPCSQSNNYLSFTTDELGDYALVARSTSNIHVGTDILQNNSRASNGFHWIHFLQVSILILFALILFILTYLLRRKRKISH